MLDGSPWTNLGAPLFPNTYYTVDTTVYYTRVCLRFCGESAAAAPAAVKDSDEEEKREDPDDDANVNANDKFDSDSDSDGEEGGREGMDYGRQEE